MDGALNNFQTHGTPVVFSDYMTQLVNAEAQYQKDHKKYSNCISQASSSARSHGQSNSGGDGKLYNTTTGET